MSQGATGDTLGRRRPHMVYDNVFTLGPSLEDLADFVEGER